MTKPWNLVLICSDTFRADYLGCYGNDWIKTPRLDELAAQSASFLDCYGEGLPTLPARRVMLTGRRIIPFRMIKQPNDLVGLPGWHPLFAEDVALSETLSDRGYATCFVTDVYHMMKPGKNFHRGFEYWYWIRGEEDDRFHMRDETRIHDVYEKVRFGRARSGQPHKEWAVQHMNGRVQWNTDADTFVARVMQRGMDWLDDYTLDRPFFLYLDCFDPHEPWDPPREYADLYDPGYEGQDPWLPPGHVDQLGPGETFERVRACYAGEVTMVDRWVGKVLDKLRSLKLMDNTLVVFTSDHGCMMGEQGEIHKGGDRLRHQVTRVPLIVRHPEGQGAGRKLRGFVQHQDIMPTALRLIGQPIPDRVNGDDFWPMVTDAKPGLRDTVVSAFGWYASVRTAEWNLVTLWQDVDMPAGHTPRRELYHLTDDPDELTNVIDRHPAVVADLKARLDAYIQRGQPDTGGTAIVSEQVDPSDQARL